MLNPYVIILGLFTLTGFAAAAWGWRIIAKGRETMRWPTVEGVVEKCEPPSSTDLLPTIEYRYSVAGASYHRALEFPPDITPTAEYSADYVKRYPPGRTVTVHYNPGDPAQATLEPGVGRGDWMVFALGAGMAVFGVVFLLAGL